MANDGIVVVSDQTIGYTERLIHVQWDITPDLMTERELTLLKPYYSLYSARSINFARIQYLYMTRWIFLNYTPIPITERNIYVYYSLKTMSERYIYYYPDTRERLCYVESIFTNTPLLLKYPKYFNWTYIPQILTPEFIIWSYYPLDMDNVTIKIVGSSGTIINLNSGAHKEKFKITRPNGAPILETPSTQIPQLPQPDPFGADINKLLMPLAGQSETDKQYKITVYVDHTFESNETINCYITAFDMKGQPLLPGLW